MILLLMIVLSKLICMQFKDFTVGPNFALDKLQAFVADLHQNGQHFGKYDELMCLLLTDALHCDFSCDSRSWN